MSTPDLPSTEAFAGPGWRLRRPRTPFRGRTVYVPTVHPHGDQRVLRCAQSLLDAGYGVHLVWMGGEPGTDHWDERLAETRLPAATSRRDRLKALTRLVRLADQRDAAGWHVHDFYMLPLALSWHWLRRRPVIYDVHEYYGPLYGAKLPPPLRPLGSRVIDAFQGWAAARLGGANVVAPEMAPIFERAGGSVAVTPNYPLSEVFAPARRPSSPQRLRRVVHTGTLTPQYGSRVLVDIAKILADRGSEIQIVALGKFPSEAARLEFEDYVRSQGTPATLVLRDAVPAHAVPDVLGEFGIGLSVLQDHGQNRVAVASKLFEYVLCGLAIVASDLDAQSDFVRSHAVGRLAPPEDPAAYAAAIEELAEAPAGLTSALDRTALDAEQHLTWEKGSSPALEAMAIRLLG